jgi:hypothetical protein
LVGRAKGRRAAHASRSHKPPAAHASLAQAACCSRGIGHGPSWLRQVRSWAWLAAASQVMGLAGHDGSGYGLCCPLSPIGGLAGRPSQVQVRLRAWLATVSPGMGLPGRRIRYGSIAGPVGRHNSSCGLAGWPLWVRAGWPLRVRLGSGYGPGCRECHWGPGRA